jgi:hypothetical protein
MRLRHAGGLIALAALISTAVANAGVAAGNVTDFLASAHARANYYRAMAKLPLYELAPGLSSAAALHAHYLVANRITDASIVIKNRQVQITTQKEASRSEKEGAPFYSNAGASVAYYAVVLNTRRLDITGADFVDQIATMPITGLYGLLYPQLVRLGAGGYCGEKQCAIVMTFRAGLEKAQFLQIYEGEQHDRMWNPSEGPLPLAIEHLKSPIEFPPDGSLVNLSSYEGTDLPNALAACPGYSAPTGPGISLQLGEGNGPAGAVEVTEYSLTRDGAQLDSCLVSAESAAGSTPADIAEARRILTRWGAVILIPRQPLTPGRYQVSITADSKPYTWSFTVASDAANTTAAMR